MTGIDRNAGRISALTGALLAACAGGGDLDSAHGIETRTWGQCFLQLNTWSYYQEMDPGELEQLAAGAGQTLEALQAALAGQEPTDLVCPRFADRTWTDAHWLERYGFSVPEDTGGGGYRWVGYSNMGPATRQARDVFAFWDAYGGVDTRQPADTFWERWRMGDRPRVEVKGDIGEGECDGQGARCSWNVCDADWAAYVGEASEPTGPLGLPCFGSVHREQTQDVYVPDPLQCSTGPGVSVYNASVLSEVDRPFSQAHATDIPSCEAGCMVELHDDGRATPTTACTHRCVPANSVLQNDDGTRCMQCVPWGDGNTFRWVGASPEAITNPETPVTEWEPSPIGTDHHNAAGMCFSSGEGGFRDGNTGDNNNNKCWLKGPQSDPGIRATTDFGQLRAFEIKVTGTSVVPVRAMDEDPDATYACVPTLHEGDAAHVVDNPASLYQWCNLTGAAAEADSITVRDLADGGSHAGQVDCNVDLGYDY